MESHGQIVYGRRKHSQGGVVARDASNFATASISLYSKDSGHNGSTPVDRIGLAFVVSMSCSCLYYLSFWVPFRCDSAPRGSYRSRVCKSSGVSVMNLAKYSCTLC